MLIAPLLAAVVLAAPPVTLTAADNGRLVRVASRAPVVLRLPENPSTGYRWKLVAVNAHVVNLVSHRYQPPPDGSPLGKPGISVWRFTTVARGRTVLRLGYLRSWQPKTVVKRFRVALWVS